MTGVTKGPINAVLGTVAGRAPKSLGDVGSVMGIYWDKTVTILEKAIENESDDVVKQGLLPILGGLKGVGIAMNALFIAVDEFKYGETDRTTEWIEARIALRTLASVGA